MCSSKKSVQLQCGMQGVVNRVVVLLVVGILVDVFCEVNILVVVFNTVPEAKNMINNNIHTASHPNIVIHAAS